MFQSVVIFLLPLLSAALELYLKTTALGCVTDIIIIIMIMLHSTVLYC